MVNVSSIGGRCAFPAHVGYHASKFALEGFTEAIATELDPRWKIRILILEPGGTKSQFTSSSNAGDEVPRHPAYGDEELPVNQMLKAMTDPGLNEKGVDPTEVARCLFEVLGREEIPLRLPTGQDAFAAIKWKEGAKMEELEKWKAVSEGVGGSS